MIPNRFRHPATEFRQLPYTPTDDDVRHDDDICPPAKAEIKDFHSRGQIPKAQIKNPWPLNARKLVYLIPIKEKRV